MRIHGRARLGDDGSVLVSCSRVALDEAGTSTVVDVAELADAEPDPLAGVEAGWLRHLDTAHHEVVDLLAVLADRAHRHGLLRTRPWRVDRHGLVLRLEHVEGTTEQRLAFDQPADTPEELERALELLVERGRRALAAGRRPPSVVRPLDH